MPKSTSGPLPESYYFLMFFGSGVARDVALGVALGAALGAVTSAAFGVALGVVLGAALGEGPGSDEPAPPDAHSPKPSPRPPPGDRNWMSCSPGSERCSGLNVAGIARAFPNWLKARRMHVRFRGPMRPARGVGTTFVPYASSAGARKRGTAELTCMCSSGAWLLTWVRGCGQVHGSSLPLSYVQLSSQHIRHAFHLVLHSTRHRTS